MQVVLYAAMGVVAVLSIARPYVGLLVLSFMPPFEDSFLAAGTTGLSLTRYLAVAVAVAWAFSLLRKRRTPYYESSMKWGLLFLCWAGLSLGWSAYWGSSVSGMLMLLRIAGLAFMTADLANSPMRVAGVVSSFLAGCFGVGLIGVLVPSMRASGAQLTLAGTGAKEFSVCVGSVVVAASILVASRGVSRWLSGISILAGVLGAFGVASSGERGTILALVLALIVLGLVEVGRMRKVSWLLAAAVIVGATSTALLQRVGVVPDVARRFSINALASTQGEGRLGIWQEGLALIKQRPLVGHGLRTFAPLYTYGRRPLSTSEPVGGRSSHNDLLSVTVDLGIVGALLYLAFIGSAVALPLKARFSVGSPRRRALNLLVFGLLVFWIGGGLTSELFLNKAFWLLLGLSYAVARPDTLLTGPEFATDNPHTPRLNTSIWEYTESSRP